MTATLIGVFLAGIVLAASGLRGDWASTTLDIRGRPQELHLFGDRGREPVVVSSGDGGWVHLAPEVAEFLAAQNFFVVGFDTRAYLTSFTDRSTTLAEEDVPGDYRMLIDYAAEGASSKPILIGVSEGAGLSVLAATIAKNKPAVRGVIGLGLPDLNELGWRWRDMTIYLTKKTPNEPRFSTADIIARLSPVPLALIHSTHDEFVPLEEMYKVLARAGEPKKLWVVEASNHRFSDNRAELQQRLLEAIDWVRQSRP
jgi:fermentation-respiration switch protein FrsA (DUF1100 family)